MKGTRTYINTEHHWVDTFPPTPLRNIESEGCKCNQPIGFLIGGGNRYLLSAAKDRQSGIESKQLIYCPPPTQIIQGIQACAPRGFLLTACRNDEPLAPPHVFEPGTIIPA